MGVNICSFDGLILFFLAIASTELKILREKMVEAADGFSLVDCSDVQVQQESDKTVNRLLKKCIIQQIAIER